jgi:hypothetical protein
MRKMATKSDRDPFEALRRANLQPPPKRASDLVPMLPYYERHPEHRPRKQSRRQLRRRLVRGV